MLRPSGRGVRLGVAGGGVAALLVAWGLSGLYKVGADESGMVTRFGAFVAETGPGLHYHLPAPIEAVRQLPVGAPNRLDIESGEEVGAPGPMLTRDGQLADVTFSVQWRIDDPYKYLFGSSEPQARLRDAAEAAMRETVGQLTFADVTMAAHGGAPFKAASLLKAALRREDMGLSSENLEIHDVEPPAGARAGYHDMAAAHEDAQLAARGVEAYRDRGLATARTDAAKLVQASQSSRDQEVSGARGEASRFTLIDAQYRKAPQVTRERLYTEMMERVLHNTNKVIVQTPPGAGGQIVLPADLFRAKGAAAPPAQGAPQGPAGQAQGQAPADTQQGPTA